MALFTNAKLALFGLAASAGSLFAQAVAPALMPNTPIAPVEPLTGLCFRAAMRSRRRLRRRRTAARATRRGLHDRRLVRLPRTPPRTNGITFDAYSTQFYQGVTSGGVTNDFQYGGRFDLLMNIDGEKAGLWKGLFITLHDETLYGKNVNGSTGALSPVSLGQSVPQFNGSVNALTGIQFNQFLSEQFGVFAGKINTLDGFNQPFAGYRGVTGNMNMAMDFPIVAAPHHSLQHLGGRLRRAQGSATGTHLHGARHQQHADNHRLPNIFRQRLLVVGVGNLPTNFSRKAGPPGDRRQLQQSAGTPISTTCLTWTSGRSAPILPRPRGKPVRGTCGTRSTRPSALVCGDPKRAWGPLRPTPASATATRIRLRWSATVGLGGSVPWSSRPLDSWGVAYLLPSASVTASRMRCRGSSRSATKTASKPTTNRWPEAVVQDHRGLASGQPDAPADRHRSRLRRAGED